MLGVVTIMRGTLGSIEVPFEIMHAEARDLFQQEAVGEASSCRRQEAKNLGYQRTVIADFIERFEDLFEINVSLAGSLPVAVEVNVA